MFSKILIANRGEIALRIMRACKEMGIQTILVYSKADADQFYLKDSDYSVCIGPPKSKESYLDSLKILSTADALKADALHPGYGFLSEDADFAQQCADAKIIFIGPTPDAMLTAGNKINALNVAMKVGIPVLSTKADPVDNVEDAVKVANQIGYPVIIKAAGGGGGKGMRICNDDESLQKNFANAKAEVGISFKDSSLYIEKYVEGARHIEIQILADKFGNVIHLGERDCSIQRRFQKLIEISPSPIVDDHLRKQIGEAAVEFVKAINYQNAGTVEFLLAPDRKFYFIEMNTRLQVEHPVTEMVTGIDIVKQQIKIAAGEKLGMSQSDVKFNKCAVEFRINAEDPTRNFIPTPGTIKNVIFPGGPGVRVDSHIYSGYTVPPYYDSLLAKVIVCKDDFETTIRYSKFILKQAHIDGITTTIPALIAIINHPKFIVNRFDTTFVDSLLFTG
ncbi:MAG: acetyl-CoA carboxylase biotin carboxylase subunit [Planctomycetes bacterium]|nr:acetyl-CoA carboxylase biotin carboxylase subunit [Planctomycetota bacterium]